MMMWGFSNSSKFSASTPILGEVLDMTSLWGESPTTCSTLSLTTASGLSSPSSATPSLESWANADAGKYTKLELTSRFGAAVMPEMRAIDMRTEQLPGSSWISPTLQRAVQQRLDNKEQALLFINRNKSSCVDRYLDILQTYGLAVRPAAHSHQYGVEFFTTAVFLITTKFMKQFRIKHPFVKLMVYIVQILQLI